MKIRDCVICGLAIMKRPYQANSARACAPVCARTLAVREHPDLQSRLDRLDSDDGSELHVKEPLS